MERARFPVDRRQNIQYTPRVHIIWRFARRLKSLLRCLPWSVPAKMSASAPRGRATEVLARLKEKRAQKSDDVVSPAPAPVSPSVNAPVTVSPAVTPSTQPKTIVSAPVSPFHIFTYVLTFIGVTDTISSTERSACSICGSGRRRISHVFSANLSLSSSATRVSVGIDSRASRTRSSFAGA